MDTQKKVLLINDISCIGRCSLTVLHPFLSCAGFETIMLPTSLLSNHTAYPSFSFLDLTDEMDIILEKWKSLNVKFDAIISGYLGSEKQINIVKKAKELFLKEDGLFIVDPVMADNGHLYKGFNNDFPNKMKELVSIADIITPNITEASLLTNIDYKINFSEEEVNIIKNKLIEIGAKNIIITGITSKNKIGISYGNEDNTSFYYHKMIKGPIHGTGDVYLGAFTGAYLNNKTFEEANLIAAKYTYKSILLSRKICSDKNGGLPFEVNMKQYLNKIK